jgi:hypothetical protein
MGEPILPKDMAAAQPLIDVFGEPSIRKIFSRAWNLREEGIAEIEDQIMQGRPTNPSEVFYHGITIVKQTIADKIVGVTQRAIQFFINLCNTLPNVKLNSNFSKDLVVMSEHIITTLVDKLGDNL